MPEEEGFLKQTIFLNTTDVFNFSKVKDLDDFETKHKPWFMSLRLVLKDLADFLIENIDNGIFVWGGQEENG